ncbi:probable serine/threonine-protein kinase DDB_G0271682 [Actinia tenebrosa]|uniref:Probable serine/threonine-protein kinase DDB_G0271682 n=1 Tax=Actinia tenebrosa TaxID=6105 RepID=A0A6P8IGI7_ACTTE|nr:probable serine/threonine-protein kinase DDB_G0271682 [Actinia tenebrosa]
MPRANRNNHDQGHPRTQRPGRHGIVTPPNSNMSHNRTSENTPITHASPTVNLTNSTLTETQAPKIIPLLVGATTGIANSTSSTKELAQNASAINDIHNQSENVSLIPGFESEVIGNPSSVIGHSSFLSSSVANEEPNNPHGKVNKNFNRAVNFPSLFSTLGKKAEAMPIMHSSNFSPPWIQTFEKAGLLKAIASEGLPEDCSKDSNTEMKKLREELIREKAARIILEQQMNQERQQRERVEQELENMRTVNQELEQSLQASEQQRNELQATLSTAQQALEEYHSSSSSSDWVLRRDEIVVSDKVIGVGGWGKVMEGAFRGCKVAVKQIHELILSPHNRRLFEREMSIASRCRHPCLLQFIGATNDDQSPLFVTELLDTSLRAILHERALEAMEITTMGLDVSKALNYLHLNHPAPIIHRDISSANVLLWKHGTHWRGKVSDYGTANFMQYSMTVSPGAVVYSAPEAQTSRQSPKVDAYSFGVLLCEMNIREFPDTTYRNEQVAMVTNHFFRDLIRRCLQHDPEKRPDMTQIINLLENQKF